MLAVLTAGTFKNVVIQDIQDTICPLRVKFDIVPQRMSTSAMMSRQEYVESLWLTAAAEI